MRGFNTALLVTSLLVSALVLGACAAPLSAPDSTAVGGRSPEPGCFRPAHGQATTGISVACAQRITAREFDVADYLEDREPEIRVELIVEAQYRTTLTFHGAPTLVERVSPSSNETASTIPSSPSGFLADRTIDLHGSSLHLATTYQDVVAAWWTKADSEYELQIAANDGARTVELIMGIADTMIARRG